MDPPPTPKGHKITDSVLNGANNYAKEAGKKDLQINTDWLVFKIQCPVQLLQCPICFNVPFDPVECAKCQRLMCRTDYQEIKENKNVCPLCKANPWVVKFTPHIMYRHLMQSQTFKCQICLNEQPMNLTNLRQHLKLAHNSYLRQYQKKLIAYKVELGSGQIKRLKLYQNLEIDRQFRVGAKKVKVLDLQNGQLTIDKDKKTVKFTDHLFGPVQCELKPISGGNIINPDIKKENQDSQFIIWQVMGDKKQFRFMIDEHQPIIEEGYQFYKKEPDFKQIFLDLKHIAVRYLINFETMTQINVKTDFIRAIRRTISDRYDEV